MITKKIILRNKNGNLNNGANWMKNSTGTNYNFQSRDDSVYRITVIKGEVEGAREIIQHFLPHTLLPDLCRLINLLSLVGSESCAEKWKI